jgi:hypothetical protein
MSAVSGTLKKLDGTTNHTSGQCTITSGDRTQHLVGFSNASTAAFSFDVPNNATQPYQVQKGVGGSKLVTVTGASAIGNL